MQIYYFWIHVVSVYINGTHEVIVKDKGKLILWFVQGLRERSPHYHKLYARLTHIWGNRRGQPDRSAMEGPHPGGTAFMITVSPAPGKYAF